MKSALASFATLFSNILANPEDQATSNDIDLLNFVVEIVHSFNQHGGFAKVAPQLLSACEVMTRVARELVRARRRKQPMLDFPNGSILTAVETLEGQPTQFDWNSMISDPPVVSLEQFLSMAPMGDKTSFYASIENDSSQGYEFDQIAGLTPSCFREEDTVHHRSNDILSWSLNTESHHSSSEIFVNDLNDMNSPFPVQDI